ncbi:carotenoid ester lipase [Pholiota conissans]|uniref:Carboxylic ester hydrolase n=1 Tax=Pholiota conissans TaxID=109636 RepID=A0A9P5Z0W0_9AGAR|nr:carotenoid ester lipase [Pholiota conissans]
MFMNFLWVAAVFQTVLVAATPLHQRQDGDSSGPTVTLDSATVTGVFQGNLSKFLGIPFALPPVGERRFSLPEAVTSYNGSINGTSYGATCMQQSAPFPISFGQIFNESIPSIPFLDDHNSTLIPEPPPESEDCLTINVIKPSNVSADAKLPVVVWIFGGGFERGSAQGYDSQATRIVNESIAMGKPVIYAAMNYRVSAWGFLASQEVQEAGLGNMGLVDQRVALQWVQKYIHLFGGDNTKVTIWGQSAGAISVSLQMLAYGGNSADLFQGAFMQSGAPIPVGNITGGQVYYDSLVNQTNCASSNDTLSCLRQVPTEEFQAAVNNTPNYFSYQALALAWSPRADGVFLEDNPQRLVEQGKVMNIPIVSGNVDDEGTLFSLSSRNVTTNREFEEYVSTVFIPGASSSELEPLWSYYPSDASDGSPFNTSVFNEITPQYKRIAAFQGDVVFQAPRRWFLDHLSGKQKLWSYLSLRRKLTPVIGSYHSSDLSTHILDDNLIQFAYNLNPNLDTTNDSFPEWPEYTTEAPQLYTFPIFGGGDVEITNDTYREEPMQFLMNISLAYPL